MKKLLLILFCLPLSTLAQSSLNLLRSTISNSGSSTQTVNKYIIQQSVGQISPIGLKETSKHTLHLKTACMVIELVLFGLFNNLVI